MGRENRLTVRVAGLSLLPPSARDARRYEEAAREACALERAKPAGELSIVFVSRARMRALNRRYLGHDWDTDVIAFPHDPTPGVPPGETPFGDLFVSAHMARVSARELGHSPLREALTLVAHGVLHLLGRDDSTRAGRAAMFRLQDRVLRRLGA